MHQFKNIILLSVQRDIRLEAETTPMVVQIAENTPSSSGRSTPSSEMPSIVSPSPPACPIDTSCFASVAAFRGFLEMHPKTRQHSAAFSDGLYSAEARRCITQAAASKMLECYGNYPTSEKKSQTSRILAELTGLAATDYFEPKSHKGFLTKDIENLRRKLPPAERRWAWSKQKLVPAKRKLIGAASDEPLPSLPSLDDNFQTGSIIQLTTGSTTSDTTSGCPRNILECSYCDGEL